MCPNARDLDDRRRVCVRQSREAFVAAAKDVNARCQSVTQFLRVIADHCLDQQCTDELSVIVEQILTLTNQLSIISRSEQWVSFKIKA